MEKAKYTSQMEARPYEQKHGIKLTIIKINPNMLEKSAHMQLVYSVDMLRASWEALKRKRKDGSAV